MRLPDGVDECGEAIMRFGVGGEEVQRAYDRLTATDPRAREQARWRSLLTPAERRLPEHRQFAAYMARARGQRS